MYLVTFSNEDGSLITSSYKSSEEWRYIYGSAQNGNLIIVTVQCSNYHLVMMNSTSYIFTIKEFTGASLYGADAQPNMIE